MAPAHFEYVIDGCIIIIRPLQSSAAGVWACSEGAAIGIILPLLSIKGLTIRVPVLKVIVAMEAGTSVVTRDLGSARSGRGRPRLEVDRNRLEFLRGLNFTWSKYQPSWEYQRRHCDVERKIP